MAPSLVGPGQVTREQFDSLLEQYDTLIESLSESKGAKPGQKSLRELDRFRYNEAPHLFSRDDPKRPMDLVDVKTLVDWKLRHGKFRPTLMKLVSSNDAAFVSETVQDGLKVYDESADAPKTLDTLTKLKGVGPATASLLLSVHYPGQVPFFSDESYYWLCNGGRTESLKYTMKEYRTLIDKVDELMRRLKVGALDIEKVSYVLLKQGAETPSAKVAKEPIPSKAKPLTQTLKVEANSATKRKETFSQKEDSDQTPPLRRSKRARG